MEGFRRVGITVAVVVGLFASGFLLGQATSGSDNAKAAGGSKAVLKELKGIDRKLGYTYRENTVLGEAYGARYTAGRACYYAARASGDSSPLCSVP